MEKHLIDLEEIDHLADLSGLNFSDKERELMQREVSGIIGMLKQCEDVELANVSKPKTITLSELREDVIKPSLAKDCVVGQAIDTISDYIAVPKVVD